MDKFRQIIDEYGEFIRRTLAQLGVCARDLADVEQEVLRGVSRGLPAFNPALALHTSNALRSWIFAICMRQVANHQRGALQRHELLFGNDELDYEPAEGPIGEELFIERERREILEQLLACLDEERRCIIVAYELEGVPMADIACALSIPVNTAWNRLRLGREDLRAAWKRLKKRWR